MKKVIVYIDGENLRHKIQNVLTNEKIIRHKAAIIQFDFRFLLERLLPGPGQQIAVRYYGTRVKASGLKGKPREKALEMAEVSRRLKRALLRQEIDFVMCGTLQYREGHRCMHCGKLTPIFQEKGVDVRMAVDIVNEAKKGSTAIVVSSDSDLLPAVRLARQKGMRIEYVTVNHAVNWALGHNADKTHDLSTKRIVEAYRKVQHD